MADTTGTFIHLSDEQSHELLGTQTVGRLAFVDHEGQQLVPINFVVHDGDIVFRTMPGTVTAALADGHDDVAFGVDHHDDTYQQGWNVTVVGTTSAVQDEAVIAALADRRPRPWAPGERDLLIRLRPRRIDGRKVRQH
jgi:nitroimidazol reductase NimA-like FMN-containing flavoprotein (pyridoxamine 5'-phosphate oxidase superfamily)